MLYLILQVRKYRPQIFPCLNLNIHLQGGWLNGSGAALDIWGARKANRVCEVTHLTAVKVRVQ